MENRNVLDQNNDVVKDITYEFTTLIEISNNQIVINDEILREIFLDPNVNDQKVSVVAIFGNSDTNDDLTKLYLEHMYDKYPSLKNPEGPSIKPDFHLNTQQDSDSSKILIWSDVFLCESNIVILLKAHSAAKLGETDVVDRQLFAFCVLVPSVTVYIVENELKQSDLDKCKLSSLLSSRVVSKSTEKSYQDLTILVKNYKSSEECEIGFKDGEKYLLQVNEQHNGEVIANLSSKFETLKCYLMKSKDEEQNFITQLIDTQNKSLKKINSSVTRNCFLYYYIKIIASNLKSDNESPKFMFHTQMIEDYMKKLVDVCLSNYDLNVRTLDKDILQNPIELTNLCANVKANILRMFDNTRKMGCPNTIELYRKHLEDEMRKSIERWKKLQGLTKFCLLEYSNKIFKEGAKDLRVSTFVFINHEKYRSEIVNMFQDADKFGKPEDHEFFQKILIKQIEEEFTKWSKISFSYQQLISNCVEHYRKMLRELSIEQIKTEKDADKFNEICKAKAYQLFDTADKKGTVKDNIEYRQNLEEDLNLEYSPWKENVLALSKIFDICIERYKNNTIQREIYDLDTPENRESFHENIKEQVLDFFAENSQTCDLKILYQKELEMTMEKMFQRWSKKLLKKVEAKNEKLPKN